MSIKALLIDPRTGRILDIVPGPGGVPILVTQNPGMAHGVFQTASAAAAGTTKIIDIEEGAAIVLTDIIVNAQKFAASTFSLQFFDGTNTETIMSPDVVNAEVNLAIAFAGLWKGWSGADFQMVTTGNFDHRVSVGYYKVKSTLTYAEWDGLR